MGVPWVPFAVVLAAALAVLAVACLGRTCRPGPGAHRGGGASRNAMVIVEPREHRHLPYVIQNFDRHMPPDYDLYIFHGKSAAAYARESARGITRRKVFYVRLDTDNMTADQYNAFFKDRARFWSHIDAENILVFQTDAVLCGKSPQSVRNFEHLGYIGCAYDATAGKGTHWGDNHAFWGVGGLSFRKKSAALECLSRVDPGTTPEDVYYSNCVEAGIGQKPTDGMQLSGFCSQNNFLAESFGAHKIHGMMVGEQKARFLRYCPEAAPLLES